jgi:hypothetical protein
MDRLDTSAWIAIIGAGLAIPLGVISNLLTERIRRDLEKRKLVRGDATRQGAIRAYNQIKSFHNRTRDRYPYYLLLAGWAVIFAVASSTSIILLALMNPDLSASAPVAGSVFFLLLSAILFGILAVLLMATLHGTARQLNRFDDYKAELERQWGPIDPEG